MTESNNWRPLLDGRLADEAWEAVDAIVRDLGEIELKDPSLPGGLSGLAILHTYLAAARPNQGHENTAVLLLEQAIDLVAEAPARPALHGGYSGVAWAAEHMRGRVLEPDNADLNEEIVDVLLGHLASDTWEEGAYDLISGLVGIGVFALERLPHPSGRELLRRVIHHLNNLARAVPGGMSWFTPPTHISQRVRPDCPDGYYNLGMAHGVPGVLALLALAHQAGVEAENARELMKLSVPWILAQSTVDQPKWQFPSWVSPGRPPAASRSAWCYGDPGVAASLFLAGHALDEPTWSERAAAVAREVAERPAELSGIADGGLCHGAAGLAHIFNRFWHATEDPTLGAAASSWIQRLLGMRTCGKGVGGFLALEPDKNEDIVPTPSPGFLTGAAGVALALLAALTPVEPAWDRVLLLSMAPRSAHG